MKVAKKPKICKNCGKDHKKELLRRYKGVFGRYCVPIEKPDPFCDKCGKDHKEYAFTSFEGAYDTYCIPISRLRSLKLKIKNSPKFRTYLNIDDLPEDSVMDAAAWKARHRFLDTDLKISCIHAISGGCTKCYPDGYCGPSDKRQKPVKSKSVA